MSNNSIENSIIRITQPQKEAFLRLKGGLTVLIFDKTRFIFIYEILLY